jgi:hypothetical protein
MEGTPATYLGRIVEKKNFRAFIYSPDGKQRLVESWEEFEANMQSGLWFATQEDAEASKAPANDPEHEDAPLAAKAKPKPKPRPKAKPKPVPVVEADDAEDVLPDDDSVFEVKDGE